MNNKKQNWDQREENLWCLQLQFTTANIFHWCQLQIHLVNGTITDEILHSETHDKLHIAITVRKYSIQIGKILRQAGTNYRKVVFLHMPQSHKIHHICQPLYGFFESINCNILLTYSSSRLSSWFSIHFSTLNWFRFILSSHSFGQLNGTVIFHPYMHPNVVLPVPKALLLFS